MPILSGKKTTKTLFSMTSDFYVSDLVVSLIYNVANKIQESEL